MTKVHLMYGLISRLPLISLHLDLTSDVAVYAGSFDVDIPEDLLLDEEQVSSYIDNHNIFLAKNEVDTAALNYTKVLGSFNGEDK